MQVKDKNNFINVIVNNVFKAKEFKQRIKLSLTSRVLCGYIKVKFYLRKRYHKVYLYTRVINDGFGTRKVHKDFLNDICLLLPDLEIISTKGHYKGLLLDTDIPGLLTKYLKLIALLSRPQDFYKKESKLFINFLNYKHTSNIPIHSGITKSQFDKLETEDLKNVFKSLHNYNSELYHNTISNNIINNKLESS